jgi:hypothetical protein
MFDVLNYELPDGFYKLFEEESSDSEAFKRIRTYLTFLEKEFRSNYKNALHSKDSLYGVIAGNRSDSEKLDRLRIDYYNKGLATFVLNGDLKEQSVEKTKRIIRKYEPVFMPPTAKNGRAHFCAPFKMIGNLRINTLWFNVIVIWLVSLLLYIALYFSFLRKILSVFDKSKKGKDSSFLIIKEISSW